MILILMPTVLLIGYFKGFYSFLLFGAVAPQECQLDIIYIKDGSSSKKSRSRAKSRDLEKRENSEQRERERDRQPYQSK